MALLSLSGTAHICMLARPCLQLTDVNERLTRVTKDRESLQV